MYKKNQIFYVLSRYENVTIYEYKFISGNNLVFTLKLNSQYDIHKNKIPIKSFVSEYENDGSLGFETLDEAIAAYYIKEILE